MGQAHENLIAWKRADDLCVDVFNLVHERLPDVERYGLSAQLKRAAFSVPANIVEGYAFVEGGARARHLKIAVASLAELGYGLHLARRVGYIGDADLAALNEHARRTAAPLRGLLRRSLRLRSQTSSGS